MNCGVWSPHAGIVQKGVVQQHSIYFNKKIRVAKSCCSYYNILLCLYTMERNTIMKKRICSKPETNKMKKKKKRYFFFAFLFELHLEEQRNQTTAME